jgi:hypothetical protein
MIEIVFIVSLVVHAYVVRTLLNEIRTLTRAILSPVPHLALTPPPDPTPTPPPTPTVPLLGADGF